MQSDHGINAAPVNVGESRPNGEFRECRICKGGPDDGKLVRACQCRGSCEYVHVSCLERWLQCRPVVSSARYAPNSSLSSARFDASQPLTMYCEVCKSAYSVAIEERSHFDASRVCSGRSCESYFECGSLLITLVILITTPCLLWHTSSPMERAAISSHWPVLLMTALFMLLVGVMAVRKMWRRWRRLNTTCVISLSSLQA